jgi:hypothetical protein
VPGKLNLYNLGDLGVHLVETPVHSPDGSFTHAQNASVSQNAGQHGIRKRLGMAKLNADALGGGVLAIANMPFPDPFEALAITGTALYANTSTDGNTYHQRTTNGTTWTTPSDPGRWADTRNAAPTTNFDVRVRGGAVSATGLLTYVASGDAPDTINDVVTWNGSTRTTVASVSLSANEVVRGMCSADGVIHLLIANTTTNTGEVHRVDGSTVTDLGATISHEATCITWALGKFWVGTDNNRIYSFDPITQTSTVEHTISPTPGGAQLVIVDIEHFEGALYASCSTTKNHGTAATAHKVLKRAAAGTWSDITPGSAGDGDYGPLCAFNGDLYVSRNAHGAFAGCSIYRYDGSSWTLDQDVTAVFTDAIHAHALVAFNSALYAVAWESGGNRAILRRAAGAWSVVVDEVNLSQVAPVGPMGFY